MKTLFNNKLLVTWVNITFVVLLLWFVYKLISVLLLPEPIVSTQRAPVISVDSIAGKWQWFGNAEQLTAQQNLQKAQLNANVVGVVGSGDIALAVIQFSGRAEQVYRVGDSLTANASLESIEQNRIVIRENGKLFELPLQRLGKDIAANKNLLGQSTASNSANSLQLSGMARAIPVSINGKTGIQLQDLADEVVALSDLQENDVVMSVEGQDVSALMSGNSWQSMLQKTDAQVILMRDGKPVNIQVNVASLAQQMLQKIQNN